MRPLVWLAALLALPSVGQAAQAQAPLEPLPATYLGGGATAGGCRAQWQTNAPVRAYSAPTDVSAAVRTLDAARRVDANDYSEALTAVLEPGRIRLRAAVDVPSTPGSGTAGLRLAAGEDLRVLVTSDGFTTFVYGGRLYEARLGDVEVLQAPVTEVWVRLLPRDDRPAAWLNTAQAGVVAWDPVCGG